jgi:tetratricopeptide (TPR) repeat protein
VNWVEEHHRFKAFEDVFRSQTRYLGYFGDYKEVDYLLARYEGTLPAKDARYINLCEMKCYAAWGRGDFSTALEWGRKGKALKDTVDTKYDLAHTLALAERDAGNPESALPTFLEGHTLDEITDPDTFDDNKSGSYYGNIGRCLHFMGQVEPALVCYQKSALVIEKDPTGEDAVNQGFIRAWIGELLATRQEFRLAVLFLRAAYLKWENLSPPRATRAAQLLEQVQRRLKKPLNLSDVDAEKTFLDWMMGSQFAAKTS